ncbi:high mobility group box domain-containing protein, partial [Thamnidium elegans]
IFMNVKRGHRRILQREIATKKGIPRHQLLVTNTMEPSKFFFFIRNNDSGNSSGGEGSITQTNRVQATVSDNNTSGISSNEDNDSIDTNESAPIKRKYRRHAKPDRNAPIKPPSAYIMFSNDSRTELKDQNLSFAELAKIVGEQWKNLSHVEKQAYERMAMRAKDEYLADLEQYRQTSQYVHYQDYLNDFKSKQDAANRLIGRSRKRDKTKS